MTSVVHPNLTGTALHVPGYKQSSDPGAVGAGVEWIDTSTTPFTHKSRNTGNSGWDTVGGNGAGSVTSVALTGDGTVFNSSVTGSPVTASGTLAPSLHTQAANVVLAGPPSGGAVAPTFRALVTADMPAGTGTVTAVSGSSPLASSGGATPAISIANQAANKVLAGPTSGGSGAVTARALVPADLPAPLIAHESAPITVASSDPTGVTHRLESGADPVGLPPAGAVEDGWEVAFILVSGPSSTINTDSHEDLITIGGAVNALTLSTVGQAVRLQSDGVDTWFISAGYGL